MSKPLISLMSAALLASASMAATAADMIPPETASRFIRLSMYGAAIPLLYLKRAISFHRCKAY